VVLDDNGNLYIADVSRMRKVSPAGIISTLAIREVPMTVTSLGAQGISLDQSGNLYIAGSFVFKLSPNGVISVVAGNGESPDFSGDGGAVLQARLNAPTGVAVDTSGNLYIADSGNYRVRKVSTAGVITTVAGNGISGYSGDGGPATQALLGYPYKLEVASDGISVAGLDLLDGTPVLDLKPYVPLFDTPAGPVSAGWFSARASLIFERTSDTRFRQRSTL